MFVCFVVVFFLSSYLVDKASQCEYSREQMKRITWILMYVLNNKVLSFSTLTICLLKLCHALKD